MCGLWDVSFIIWSTRSCHFHTWKIHLKKCRLDFYCIHTMYLTNKGKNLKYLLSRLKDHLKFCGNWVILSKFKNNLCFDVFKYHCKALWNCYFEQTKELCRPICNYNLVQKMSSKSRMNDLKKLLWWEKNMKDLKCSVVSALKVEYPQFYPI